MANGNPQPGNKARHPGGVKQPQVHRLVAKHRGQEAQTGNHRCGVQCVARYAATGQFREDTRRFTVTCQRVEHTGGRVHSGITGRKYGGQNNGVHHCRGRKQTGMLEDQRERANANVFDVITQQAWIGVRNDQADNQDREHIEQQDTPEDLTNRARNILLRVF